jgi:exodeoxyribonuclease-5
VPEVLPTDADGAPVVDRVVPAVQGGRERGIILHKLIEEVLTGETAETEPDIMARAEVLIRAMGRLVADDPARGLAPAELAACVARALALPEIVVLRPLLLPEVPVYASVSAAEEGRKRRPASPMRSPSGLMARLRSWSTGRLTSLPRPRRSNTIVRRCEST